MSLQEKMKAWREKWGVSQEFAARLFGVSLMTWNVWENGATPKPSNLIKLEAFLKKPPENVG